MQLFCGKFQLNFYGVTKHCTGSNHMSFRDLFMQISNILLQPAGMAVPKCINHWPHCWKFIGS